MPESLPCTATRTETSVRDMASTPSAFEIFCDAHFAHCFIWVGTFRLERDVVGDAPPADDVATAWASFASAYVHVCHRTAPHSTPTDGTNDKRCGGPSIDRRFLGLATYCRHWAPCSSTSTCYMHICASLLPYMRGGLRKIYFLWLEGVNMDVLLL